MPKISAKSEQLSPLGLKGLSAIQKVVLLVWAFNIKRMFIRKNHTNVNKNIVGTSYAMYRNTV
jgi:hypothetical protein